MANEEHLARLEQGVEAWNQWRASSAERPDLSGSSLRGRNLNRLNLSQASLSGVDFQQAELCYVDLSNADLYGANLSAAYLVEAKLGGADLSGAGLVEAHLVRADLKGANLSEARLSGADLRGADLSNAGLNGADLSSANLFEADLSGASLEFAILGFTIFGNTNLTAVQALESCYHQGPSVVDHRTVAQSGDIPRLFLRGCGLPDELIDYLPSLPSQPLVTSSVTQADSVQSFRAYLYYAPPVVKHYEPPNGFLLDEPKVREIRNILIDRLKHFRVKACPNYEVYRADHSYFKTKKIDSLFSEENSDQKKLTRLSVSVESNPQLKVLLVFHKTSASHNTTLTVEGEDENLVAAFDQPLREYLSKQVNTVRDWSKLKFLLTMKIGLLFILNTAALQPLSATHSALQPAATVAGQVMIILAILLVINGGLRWYLGNEVVDDHLFPGSFFLLGKEVERYAQIRESRQSILFIVTVALVLGILVNLWVSLT